MYKRAFAFVAVQEIDAPTLWQVGSQSCFVFVFYNIMVRNRCLVYAPEA